ncbi:MAG: DUF1080 domain-containing protein [Planctomycetes bacterium]|nr:DUF1080 domain-containing protein [Planctomycetota bacterium]
MRPILAAAIVVVAFLCDAGLFAAEAAETPCCAKKADAPCCPAAACPKEAEKGFVNLFDGASLDDGWQGTTNGYVFEDGVLVCKKDGGGKLLTTKEYADFILRFDFKLPPGGNNGIAIRAPLDGRLSRTGIEIQVLDDTADRYKKLKPYQYHGSVYGMVPAKRGHLKPVGEWNCEEILVQGAHFRITLNGVVIVDADLATIDKPMDGYEHPGRFRAKGFLGFMGHGTRVEFRNFRIKELDGAKP